MRPYNLCLFFVVACFAVIGCERKPTSEVYSVSGTVTLDGQPAIDISINFALEAGPPVPMTVRTDESGHYVLHISKALNHWLPGAAIVSFEADDRRTNGMLKKYSRTVAAQNPEMRVDVKRGKNTLDFDLSSQ